LTSTAATGSESLSLVGIAAVPFAANSFGVLSAGPAPAAGLEAYWTLRSWVSEILLSSVTNDSPHHALQKLAS
jgi:hypothetical protein